MLFPKLYVKVFKTISIENLNTHLREVAEIPLKSARFGLVRILPKLEGQ